MTPPYETQLTNNFANEQYLQRNRPPKTDGLFAIIRKCKDTEQNPMV